MILKAEIQAVVTGQRKVILKELVLTKRDASIKIKPFSTHVEVITGIRRCGKSTLMRQIISESQAAFCLSQL